MNTMHMIHVDLSLAYQIEKLLVPTPDPRGTFKEKTALQGFFSSFADAPGGFSEEINEISHQLGTEVKLKISEDFAFAIRGGGFLEHASKGGRQYFTLGGGIKIWRIHTNIAVPSNSGAGTWKVDLAYHHKFKSKEEE